MTLSIEPNTASRLGYFIVPREIMTHPAMGDPIARGVFFDLVSRARYQSGAAYLAGRSVQLTRGQVAITLRDEAARQGLTKDSLHRRLARLEAATFIETRRATAATIITICNYGKFQGVPASRATANATRNETARDSDATPTATADPGLVRQLDPPSNPSYANDFVAGVTSSATAQHEEARQGADANRDAIENELSNKNSSGEGRSRAVDPAKRVFSLGRDLLFAYGKNAKQAGAIIGAWRKRAPSDGDLIKILVEAQAQERDNIVAYVEGCLRKNLNGGNHADALANPKGRPGTSANAAQISGFGGLLHD